MKEKKDNQPSNGRRRRCASRSFRFTSSDHVFERDKNSCIDLGIDIPPQLPYTMKHCTVRAQYSDVLARGVFDRRSQGPLQHNSQNVAKQGRGPLGTWQCRKFHPSQPIHHIEGEVGYVQCICFKPQMQRGGRSRTGTDFSLRRKGKNKFSHT